MDPHRNLWSPPIVEPTIVSPDNPVTPQPYVPPVTETPPQPVVSAPYVYETPQPTAEAPMYAPAEPQPQPQPVLSAPYAYDTAPQAPTETPAYAPPAQTQTVDPTTVDQQIAAGNYAAQPNDYYALPYEKPSKLQRMRAFAGRHQKSLIAGGVSFLLLISIMSYAVAHLRQNSTPQQLAKTENSQASPDDESVSADDASDESADTAADEDSDSDSEVEDTDVDDDSADIADEPDEVDDTDYINVPNEDILEDEDDEDAPVDNSSNEKVNIPPPTVVPAKPSPIQPHKFTVGSWNTNSDNKKNVGTETLDILTKTQVIGLQELHDKPQRDSIKSKVICSTCKYAGYIPSYSSGGASAASYPIIWDKSAFSLVGSGNSQQMCDAAKSSKYSYAARYATYVRLQSKVNGKQFYVISTHLMAGEGSKGKPTTDTLLTSRYKTHMSKLTTLVNSLKTANIPIYVTGTFNVDYRYDRTVKTSHFPYTALGATSVRSSYDYLSLSGIASTKGSVSSSNRLIDYVFALQRSDMTANTVSLSTSGHGSSHYAVFFTSTVK